jgi:hypothetical protein
MPFPYPKIIVVIAPNVGHGNAVSLPQNNRSNCTECRTRQCRFPTPK